MRKPRISDEEIIKFIRDRGGSATAYDVRQWTKYKKMNTYLRLNKMYREGKINKGKIGGKLTVWYENTSKISL